MKGVPSTLIALILLTAPCFAVDKAFQQSGTASWYGSENRRCASGEAYSPTALTAAHRTLPFGTKVKVTNLSNDCSVVLRVTDRGPFTRKRVIDVSKAAAKELRMIQSGTARVKLELVAAN